MKSFLTRYVFILIMIFVHSYCCFAQISIKEIADQTVNTIPGPNEYDDRVELDHAGDILADIPVSLPPPGLYSETQAIMLASNTLGAAIYYTTDGTLPSIHSTLYSAPITISATTVFRAIAAVGQSLLSDVATFTFLINEETTLPVVSLVTDPANLFNDRIGIYVIGTNGVSGYCANTPMNLNQDWERPVHVELFDKMGVLQINQDAGVKIFGGCSRTRYPQKSLSLHARKQHGKGKFNYQLFESKPIESFESFILRSSSDDAPFTLFRDALAQTLVSGPLNVDGQAYQPCVVFINGNYWGIHNIRESLNDDYPAGNYGVDPEITNVVKRNPEDSWNISNGTADHYIEMLNYIKSRNMNNDAAFDYVKTQMDVDNYIDYQITQIYLGADDWPGNNIKFWQSPQKPYDRWRWIMYDLDWTLFNVNRNTLSIATEPNCNCTWPNPPWSTLLFRKMLENTGFKNEFLQKYALYMATVFAQGRINHYVDSLSGNIRDEIPRHISRWGGQKVPNPEGWIKATFNSVAEWESNINVMRNFASDRPEIATQQIFNYFGLSAMSKVSFSMNIEGAGNIYVYNRKIAELPLDVSFFTDVSLTLHATNQLGYLFSHWEISGSGIISNNYEPELYFTPSATSTIKAVYSVNFAISPAVIINEINYFPNPLYNAGEWVELHNRTAVDLDISGWIVTDKNINWKYVFNENTILAAHGYHVVCADQVKFYGQYEEVTNTSGNFAFSLGNSDDIVRLLDQYSMPVDFVPYYNTEEWGIEANGQGATLQLRSPDLNNTKAQNWHSTLMMGTPGAINRQNNEVYVEDFPMAKNSGSGMNVHFNAVYPNPFKNECFIKYNTLGSVKVDVVVHDFSGRRVVGFQHEHHEPGVHVVEFSAQHLPPGIYLVTVIGNGFPAGSKRVVKK